MQANIIYFISGGIVGGIVIGTYFISAYDQHFVQELGNYQSYYFRHISVSALLLIAAMLFARFGKKWAGRGMMVVPLVTLIVNLSLYLRLAIPFYQFDTEKWKAEDPKPFLMAVAYYHQPNLIGKSKAKLIKDLGEGITDVNFYRYPVEDKWELVFHFSADTIMEVDMFYQVTPNNN